MGWDASLPNPIEFAPQKNHRPPKPPRSQTLPAKLQESLAALCFLRSHSPSPSASASASASPAPVPVPAPARSSQNIQALIVSVVQFEVRNWTSNLISATGSSV
ncbi:hypothetical protein BOTCAL_0153g00130 [Botryotinia calthae]|uniref:Uncharacterized protein n=1 Tax=Botryotinia calthae TaxID=38488 RepID=A0A4Y8D2R9_9HELO|nr:hypothetical protein BOTCAL_0153g00130 [Botryotinia calthae]